MIKYTNGTTSFVVLKDFLKEYFQLFQLSGSVRIRAYIVSTNVNTDKYQMSLFYKNCSRSLQSHNLLKMFGSMFNLQGVQNLSVNMWRIDILNFCSSEAELTNEESKTSCETSLNIFFSMFRQL